MSGDSRQHDEAQAAFGTPQEPRQASALGYWLAAMLCFAAIAGAIGWVVDGLIGLDDRVNDLHRVAVPGEQLLALEEGRQAVYYESAGGEDATIPRLEIRLEPAEGGAPVVVGPHGGDVSYSVGGYAGRSMAGFEIEDAGSYRMTVRARSENVPAGALLAVGPGIGGRIVRAVVGGLAIFFGGLLLAGLTIAITAARRRRT